MKNQLWRQKSFLIVSLLAGILRVSLHAQVSFESFMGYNPGVYLPSDLPSPVVAGYTNNWTLVDFGTQPAKTISGPLFYTITSGYAQGSANHVGVPNNTSGGEITSANSGRCYRVLDSSLAVNSSTAGTRYLSFLYQNGLETGGVTYQMLELYNGSTADANRTFAAGIGNGATQYNFEVNSASAYTSTTTNADTRVHLFVVKFNLSATAGADSVTVWLDPTLGAGDPAGGITISGQNIVFDRLSISDYDGNSCNWGEIRWGTNFDGVTIVAPPSPTAPTFVWSGGGTDNNWTTGGNWTNGTAPVSSAPVVFAGTSQTTVNLNVNSTVGWLGFDSTAGSFSITNSTNTLSLNGGLTNNSANAQTINVPVTLNLPQAISAAAGSLTFGQNINNNGNTVTFAGSGNITLSNNLTGGGGVVYAGTGTLTIPLPIAPVTSYTGNTVIQSGTLKLMNPGFWICTSPFSGAGNLVICTNVGAFTQGRLLLWGADNLTGTTTVSNGMLFVGVTPNQSLGSTIRVLDGATFGVNARADTNYVSPASLIIGSSAGGNLQFGLLGISEPGLTGTNNAPIRATNVTINGTATINIASCPFATNSYPLFTGYSSGTLALGAQPFGYSGKLTVSGSTVYYTVTNLDSNGRPFTHPGCLSTSDDFARMKAKVQAGAHPWIDSYNILAGGASSNYQNHATVQLLRYSGGGNTYQFLAWDANAAYELSLRWKITGDNNYADAAVRIFNAWFNTCTYVGGDPNAQLIALNGYQFACAAENLHTYTNWAAADFARFQWWFRTGPGFNFDNGWWVGSPRGFLRTHWGQCPEHDWANWDLCNMDQLLAISVLCDDRELYNFALNYYKTGWADGSNVQGNGTANRVIYQMHPGYMGQWQEAGRDQGHAMMGPVLLGFFCEIAWNQSDDIFSYYTDQLLAGAEYETKWNEAPQSVVENNSIPLVLTTNSVPYVSYFNCSGDRQTDLAGASRGNTRMGYDLIYNHFVNIMGLDAPYTGVYMSQIRPEGAGDNDVIGYTTLTHYLDPISSGSTPAPSAVIAQVQNAAATVSWLGSASATSYNVKRSTNNGASYTTVATGITRDHYYVDTGLLPGSNYLYVVSAIVNGAETTNSLPVVAQANQLLSGTVIGASGSYDCCANIYRVFDGGLRDWYDAANVSGDWAGLDLGSTNKITQVGYCPRPSNAGRMVGGQFQGCNDSNFVTGVVILSTVLSGPADTLPPVMTYQTISNPNAFRYVRYIGPANGSCNVAEVQFFGTPASASAQPQPTLHTYLKFDESSGTSAADSTGNGWNGTLVNSATWVAGHNNNAVNLSSGSSQYVTMPAAVLTDLTDFSIAAWVKQTTVSTWSRIFDFGTGTSVYMFLTPQNGANNRIRFAITTGGGGGEQYIDGTAALPTGVWKHIAVTMDGSNGVLYVDGVAVGTNSAMTLKPSNLGITTLNYIGKSQYNDPYFNGQVDDFRIYSGALSAGDVATFVTPLAAPANVIASAGSSQVTLGWSAAANASCYNILRSLANGGPYAQITNVPATTFTDTALTNGVMYYYVVRAANTVGESPNSIQVSARPVSSVPANLLFNISGGQLQFSWPADHTGWRLQMNTNLVGGSWLDVPGTSGSNSILVAPTNSNAFFRLIYP